MSELSPQSVIFQLKLKLIETMNKERIRPVDLARLMTINPQDVTRIMSLSHNSKVETLSQAFSVMGYTLGFSVTKEE